MLCNLGKAGAFFRRGEEKQSEKKKRKGPIQMYWITTSINVKG